MNLIAALRSALRSLSANTLRNALAPRARNALRSAAMVFKPKLPRCPAPYDHP